MKFLEQNPFIRLLLPLVIGILMVSYLPIESSLWLEVVIWLVLIVILILALKLPYYRQYLFGIGVFVAFLVVGIARVKQCDRKFDISGALSDTDAGVGVILNQPKETAWGYKCLLLLEHKQEQGVWKASHSQLLAYFAHDSLSNELEPGKKIVFQGKIKPLNGQRNPFDFDFRKYMQNKQVFESVSIEAGNYSVVPTRTVKLKQWALLVRSKLLFLYEKAGIEGEELHVFSALTLGYKDKLSATLRQDYAGAGAMHVLAVSGLHVGLIFKLLLWLFSAFDKKKILSITKWIVVLLAIWFYAFLAGLPASVSRSAIMFSFIVIGKMLSRDANIYNSIAASAFLLLLYNPYLLYDVGFQLSYFAVTGIIFFYPYFRRWVYFKSNILQKIWEGIAVSLAAQLATSPISIFYFEQFPVYFWLSSIVVVLFAYILMNGAVLLSVLSGFLDDISWFGWIIDSSVWAMNQFVHWINTLPQAVVKINSIDGIQVVLLYILLIAGSAFLILKRTVYIKGVLFCLIMIFGYRAYVEVRKNRQQAICIYHLRNASVVHVVDGKDAIWLVSTGIDSSDFDRCRESANNYWSIKSDSVLHFDSLHSEVKLFNNWGISDQGVINKDFMLAFVGKETFVHNLKLDALLYIDKLPNGLPKVEAEHIFAGNVKYWALNKFVEELKEERWWYTLNEGAWIRQVN